MKLFRISSDRSAANIMSGTGAAYVGGRWSSPGYRVIYGAATVELAIAEFRASLDHSGIEYALPQECVIAEVNVPDHVSRLNVRRIEIPHEAIGGVDFERTRALGDGWVQSRSSCMLAVPTRVADHAFVYLINPLHRDFEDITVRVISSGSLSSTDAPMPSDRRMVFLCHASEDKESVVRPVKAALFARNINSWIDEAEITLGDSITSKVNKGLANAEYVVVFISPSFIRKPWPVRELNAALNREARTGRKCVIPIVIHYPDERVDYAGFLPLAEDKLYGVWDGNSDRLAEAIARSIGQSEDASTPG